MKKFFIWLWNAFKETVHEAYHCGSCDCLSFDLAGYMDNDTCEMYWLCTHCRRK